MKDQLAVIVAAASSSGISLNDFLEIAEREFLIHSIRSRNGNKSRTAIDIKIHRNTLSRKIKHFKITNQEYDPRILLRKQPRGITNVLCDVRETM